MDSNFQQCLEPQLHSNLQTNWSESLKTLFRGLVNVGIGQHCGPGYVTQLLDTFMHNLKSVLSSLFRLWSGIFKHIYLAKPKLYGLLSHTIFCTCFFLSPKGLWSFLPQEWRAYIQLCTVMHKFQLHKNPNENDFFPVYALSENKLNKQILLTGRISSKRTASFSLEKQCKKWKIRLKIL